MSGKGITQALVEMQLHLCPEYSLSNKSSKFYKISSVRTKIMITRGQSNLTKSASRGAHSPVMGHRLATVHARDNQPTNQRRHDTAYLNKRLFY